MLKLNKLLSLLTILIGIYNIIVIMTPVYQVNGVIEGFIALSWYKLIIMNKDVNLNFLNSINFLSIPILILSIFLISFGILSFIIKNPNQTREILLSCALSNLAMSPFIFSLGRILESSIDQLNRNFSMVTSAGNLIIGSSHVINIFDSLYIYFSPIVISLLYLIIILFIYEKGY